MFNPREIEPMGDRIILMPLAIEEQSAVGLYLAKVGDDPPTMGEVVAVGPGCYSEHGTWLDQPFRVGDQVLHSKYAGTPVRIGTEEVIILSARDVLVRLQRGPLGADEVA